MKTNKLIIVIILFILNLTILKAEENVISPVLTDSTTLFPIKNISMDFSKMVENEKGNGGDGVVCYNEDKSIKSVTFFDHHEMNYRHPDLSLDLGKDKQNYKQKIDYVIKRLKKINPSRATLYKKWWNEFEENTARLRGYELVDIPDVGNARIPRGCNIEQLAVQENPSFPSDKLYTINQDLVDHLSEDGHAGLILHELILREANLLSEGDHGTTKFVRRFNSFLSSSKMNRITHRDFISEVLNDKMGRADIHGIPFLYTIEDTEYYGSDCKDVAFDFYPNGSVKSLTWQYTCIKFSKGEYLENDGEYYYQISKHESRLYVKGTSSNNLHTSQISFYSNGLPKEDLTVGDSRSNKYSSYINFSLGNNRSININQPERHEDRDITFRFQITQKGNIEIKTFPDYPVYYGVTIILGKYKVLAHYLGFSSDSYNTDGDIELTQEAFKDLVEEISNDKKITRKRYGDFNLVNIDSYSIHSGPNFIFDKDNQLISGTEVYRLETPTNSIEVKNILSFYESGAPEKIIVDKQYGELLRTTDGKNIQLEEGTEVTITESGLIDI